jgi:hypothetical protein
MAQPHPGQLKISPPHVRRGRPATAGILLSLLAYAILLAGCAKTGDPHPPEVLVPKPAVDLAARQYSDQVLLTVSMPDHNTNGSPMTTLGVIEVWRRIEERTKETAPMTETEFLKGADKILSITVDHIAPYQKEKTLLLRDELSVRDRSQIYTKSFRYAVRFVNRKKQSAGLSNQSVAAPIPIPAAPGRPAAEVTQDFVRLKWNPPSENMDGSAPPRVAGYNVYRSEDPKAFPAAPLNQEPVPNPEFEDRSFEFDKTYFYSVSIVGSRENPYAESLASTALMVAPRDTFPPGAPQNLNAVAAGPAVLLLWVPPPERDVAGYRIYRRMEGETTALLLQQELVKSPSYRDVKAQPGKSYVYRVTAIDTHGNEGPAAEAAVEVR